MNQLYKLYPYDKFKIVLSEEDGVKRYSQDQNGEDAILIFSHIDGSYCKCWYYGELHSISATTNIGGGDTVKVSVHLKTIIAACGVIERSCLFYLSKIIVDEQCNIIYI